MAGSPGDDAFSSFALRFLRAQAALLQAKPSTGGTVGVHSPPPNQTQPALHQPHSSVLVHPELWPWVGGAQIYLKAAGNKGAEDRFLQQAPSPEQHTPSCEEGGQAPIRILGVSQPHRSHPHSTAVPVPATGEEVWGLGEPPAHGWDPGWDQHSSRSELDFSVTAGPHPNSQEFPGGQGDPASGDPPKATYTLRLCTQSPEPSQVLAQPDRQHDREIPEVAGSTRPQGKRP